MLVKIQNINEIVEIKYKIDELLDSKNYEYCKKEWLNLFEKCKNSKVSELRRFYKLNYKYVEILPNSALFNISNGFIEIVKNNRNIIYILIVLVDLKIREITFLKKNWLFEKNIF